MDFYHLYLNCLKKAALTSEKAPFHTQNSLSHSSRQKGGTCSLTYCQDKPVCRGKTDFSFLKNFSIKGVRFDIRIEGKFGRRSNLKSICSRKNPKFRTPIIQELYAEKLRSQGKCISLGKEKFKKPSFSRKS